MSAASAALVSHIKANLVRLNEARLPDEYYYASIPLCIIDAVFSIGVRYESTRRTVRDWCRSQVPAWRVIARTPGSEPRRSQHTLKAFITLLEGKDFRSLAQAEFKNSQRTSSTNGILKAEAVYRFAAVLRDFGVDDFPDTCDQALNDKILGRITEIKGQGSGLSFDYFQMLAGLDGHVKADRMVRRFVADALGSTVVPAGTAQALVIEACQLLKEEFPYLTPRLLDYEIWNYQRSRRSAGGPALVG